MKIIVSEDGLLWNAKSLSLGQYAKDVIVISFQEYGRDKHENQYKYLELEARGIGLGMDEYHGMSSGKYATLCEKADELMRLIGYDRDVLVLTDNRTESLYPYKLLQSIAKDKNIHLWAIAPFEFEGERDKRVYNELVSDLSNTKSVISIKPVLPEEHKKMNFMEYIDYVRQQINELLPKIYDKLQYLQEDYNRKYFYDHEREAYFDTNLEIESLAEGELASHRLGKVTYESMVIFEKKNLLYAVPRNDGKELCNALKKARIELAKANGIEFHTEECPFDGPCGGTCKKCDEELVYLRREIEKIAPSKVIYPELVIGDKFVSGCRNTDLKKRRIPKIEPLIIPDWMRRKNDE